MASTAADFGERRGGEGEGEAEGEETVRCFRNALLLKDGAFVKDDLWVRNGKVIDPRDRFFDERKAADINIDIKGRYLVPGFIDIQLNGAYGVDFSSSANAKELASGLKHVRRQLLRHGVTAFCPTVVTSSPDTYRQALPVLRRQTGSADGAAVLGAHLEGPFINPVKKGAHAEHLIRDLSGGAAALEECYGSELDGVAIVTLAPELKGADDATRALKEKGIVISVGHTACDLAHAEHAIEKGASCITHLFNAMTAFHHRDPGLVGLLPYSAEGRYRTFYGLIVDGFHTHDASVRLAYAMHPKGCILVTDATAAMGLEPGLHKLGDMTVELADNFRLTLKDSDTLAGSAVTMDATIRNFAAFAGLVNAIEAASLHPAQLLGIEQHKGSLSVGCDADFVILDESLKVNATFIAGSCVWNAHWQQGADGGLTDILTG